MLHLGSAFSTFFKNRKGYPAFKSKHGKQSFSLMSFNLRFKEKELFIPKSKDPLRVKWSRELPNSPSSATINKTPSGKYFISFVCEYIPVKTNGTGQIGLDLGLKDFLVTSDGTKISNPKYLKNKERHLKRVQQALSRKKKGSKNRAKARIKVALVHEKIVNTRNDFLHKLSTNIINENQVIGVEKLKVSNMIKNHSLAKSISDVAWGRFCQMLNYKALASQNCSIVYMDTWYPSSHLCSVDGYLLEHKLKLSDRLWTCPQCGTVHDRDINAAKNILKVTLATVKEHLVLPGAAMILLAK
jgi:putative transposase